MAFLTDPSFLHPGKLCKKTLTDSISFIEGKSPVIIDPACDLKVTTKRLLWGKVVNAGQTCVAPDYVLVPKDFQDTFVGALKDTYVLFFHFIFSFSFVEIFALARSL